MKLLKFFVISIVLSVVAHYSGGGMFANGAEGGSKSKLHLAPTKAFLPLEGILDSLVECQVLVLPSLERVEFSKLRNSHIQYDYATSSEESGTGQNLSNWQFPHLKHLRCSAIISTTDGVFDEFSKCKELGEGYDIMIHWKAYIYMECRHNFRPPNELLLSPKIHLLFLNQEFEELKLENEVFNLPQHHDKKLRRLFDFERTYYFRFNEEQQWSIDQQDTSSAITIAETFLLCWFCGPRDDKRVNERRISVTQLRPYPCTLPDDCPLLWKVENRAERDDKYMAAWSPWNEIKAIKGFEIILKSNLKDDTPISKVSKVESAKVEAALIFALFPVNNGTLQRRSLDKFSPWKLLKINEITKFLDFIVVITGEEIKRVHSGNYMDTFIKPIDTLTWALTASSIFSLGLLVATVFSYACKNTRDFGKYFGIALSLGTAALVDQWQFGNLNKLPSLLPSEHARRVAKLLIPLFLLFCPLVMIVNNGYKSVMQANFIAAREEYSTTIHDWIDYFEQNNFWIFSQQACTLIRKLEPNWIEEPFGLLKIRTVFYESTDVSYYNKQVRPFTQRKYSERDSNCTIDPFDPEMRELCGKEGEIPEKSVQIRQVCAENFGEFTSAIYRKSLVNLFQPESEKSKAMNIENVIGIHTKNQVHENMSATMASFFGTKMSFSMIQREFSYYWPLFQKLMTHTNLKFAHTPLTPAHSNHFRIVLEFGTNSYEAQWMIHRLAALYAGGIPGILQKWSWITFPPLQGVKPWHPSEENVPADPKPISLQGTTFGIVFLGYLVGMALATCIFIKESISCMAQVGSFLMRKINQISAYFGSSWNKFQNRV